MTEQLWTHIPIMAAQIADYLLTNFEGTYIDGTLGLGGHTKYFLSHLGARACVLGFDKDEEALKMAQERVNDPRLKAFHKSYTEAPAVLKELNLPGADGALFDLGLSSYQLDNPARGFSILRDGPLDMRFDKQNPLSAAVIVNTWPMAELERVLTQYGEERNATKLALAIMHARKEAPIETTQRLKEVVETVYGPKRGKTHPATQTFQALRIACNRELESVEQVLNSLAEIIKPGGRAAILTFHSLEDRLVKTHFKALAQSGEWKLVTKHALAPDYAEVRQNRRARSAKLRVIERVKK
ncbi:16S rRNA (cytosine(1402)-N(4))-methyltransferase RsmH [Candidatus Avelusimicrobium stercoris]|uniref:16S rRNA (cytosine(1402)-N(4))-methyltransferase RsmH n=1 Tax=Candidatus Avelusimicrobium stercoris TaxID=1947924 RepID=UPI003D0AF165